MGSLTYGESQVFQFEDRLLAHVKLAIVSKLLHHESFLLNWTVPPADGSGWVSLWISRDTHLVFRFDSSLPPVINPKWIEALVSNAARTGGMLIMAEDDAEKMLGARIVTPPPVHITPTPAGTGPASSSSQVPDPAL